MLTLFIELNTPTAKANLERLRERLQEREEVSRLVLLASLEQPGLYLLVCECERPPENAWPEGARVWRFQGAD